MFSLSNEINDIPDTKKSSVDRYLPRGWLYDRRRENVDGEWIVFTTELLPSLQIIWIHTVTVHALDALGLTARRPTVFFAIGISSIIWWFGLKAAVLLLSHVLLCYAIFFFIPNLPLQWVINIGFLYICNNRGDDSAWSAGLIDDLTDSNIFYCLTWNVMRLLSFFHISYQVSKGTAPSHTKVSLDRLLGYCFYVPLYNGPPMIYQYFYDSAYTGLLATAWSRERFSRLGKLVCVVVFWSVAVELSYHFLYACYVGYVYVANEETRYWEGASLGWLLGTRFQGKYMAFYGIARVFAALDNVESPRLPICVSRVYLYSNLWRNFDVGLYDFVLRHIYIPLGGSRISLLRQTGMLVLIFVFIYYWHGSGNSLMLWAAMNCVEICLENVGKAVSSTERFLAFQHKLGPQNYLRFKAVVFVPMVVFSWSSMFVFFLQMDLGLTLAHKYFLGTVSPLATAWGYVCIYSWLCSVFRYEYYEHEMKTR